MGNDCAKAYEDFCLPADSARSPLVLPPPTPSTDQTRSFFQRTMTQSSSSSTNPPKQHAYRGRSSSLAALSVGRPLPPCSDHAMIVDTTTSSIPSVLHARPVLSFIDEETEATEFSKFYQEKATKRSVRSREAHPNRPTVASFVRRRKLAL